MNVLYTFMAPLRISLAIARSSSARINQFFITNLLKPAQTSVVFLFKSLSPMDTTKKSKQEARRQYMKEFRAKKIFRFVISRRENHRKLPPSGGF